MPTYPQPIWTPAANHILAALSREQYPLLFSNLQLVNLPRDKILYEVGEQMSQCFFILNGMISLLAITENGSATEISMVGNEGLVGVPALLGVNKAPYRVAVQIPARAMRIWTNVLLKEFERGGPLHNLITRYTHSLISQIAQSAACNRFHTIDERLCRWLLISHDRIKSDTIRLTHEALSQMLGSSRTNITAAAKRLKGLGLIDYRRGEINIVDRQGLERASCECYRIVTRELGHSRIA